MNIVQSTYAQYSLVPCSEDVHTFLISLKKIGSIPFAGKDNKCLQRRAFLSGAIGQSFQGSCRSRPRQSEISAHAMSSRVSREVYPHCPVCYEDTWSPVPPRIALNSLFLCQRASSGRLCQDLVVGALLLRSNRSWASDTVEVQLFGQYLGFTGTPKNWLLKPMDN